MKRIAMTLVGLAGLAAAAAAGPAAGAEPLKVGFSAEPYPPFTYKSGDGSWTGFEVELANAVCDIMDRDCELAPTGWGGIIPALNAGKIDFIMGSMSITDKRDKVIDFTDPYYYTRGSYVAADGMAMESEDDLEGRILGVQGGTTHATYAREVLSGMGVRLKMYDRQEQVNRDLQAGRIDVMLADQIAMNAFVKRDSVQGYEIKFQAPKHPAFGEGIGVGVREDDDDLTEALNKAIDAVLRNGTCAELSKTYFDTNICGA
jgi:polar amino acid transport system substrate-binding protein